MTQKKKHEPSNRQPHPVDIHVGKRLRERRKTLDIGQKTLAKRAGDITYQQLQKYEIAANRISASRLYEFSKALGVPVKYFFEGYTDKTRKAGKTGQQFPDTDDPVTRRQTLKLVRAYYDIGLVTKKWTAPSRPRTSNLGGRTCHKNNSRKNFAGKLLSLH